MLRIIVNGIERQFDIDDPILPDWVSETAFTSGGFPYLKQLGKKDYEAQLMDLQLELVKLQASRTKSGQRVMILFEGRDAAGKGGTIKTFSANLSARHTPTIALTKPTETQLDQLYYQRYVEHFPTFGDFLMFDRSWYNRAGVEPVMKFCTKKQHKQFLQQTPAFEKLIVDDGISLFKIWLNVGQEMQLKRFHDRRHNPLKSWKLSPIDLKAMGAWDDYTKVRNQMFDATHSKHAPWTIIRSNDKRRARLNAIRQVLLNMDYEGKDTAAIGEIDPKILGLGPHFLNNYGA